MSTEYVSSGEKIGGMRLESGDYLDIYGGGGAVNIIISSGGRVDVEHGGKIKNTKVYSGGYLYVDGTSYNTKVTGGLGYATDSETGTWKSTEIIAYEIAQYGGVTSGATIGKYAAQWLRGGASAYDATVTSNGMQFISAGSIAQKTVLNGGWQNISYEYSNLDAPSVAISTTLKNNAQQTIWYSGYASATIISGGSQIVSYGGFAKDTTVVNGYQTIFYGGSAKNVTLRSKGSQYIWTGVTMSDCIVSKGGLQYVYGGIAYKTTVFSNGRQLVEQGQGLDAFGIDSIELSYSHVGNAYDSKTKSIGSAVSALIRKGGSQIISAGGYASATRITSGGKQYIYNSGFGGLIRINGGIQYISSGGTTSSTTIYSCGKQYIYKYGSAFGTILKTGATQIVSNGGASINTKVYADASLAIRKGGKAESLNIYKNGAVIARGGNLNGISIYNKGKLSIADISTKISTIYTEGEGVLDYDIRKVKSGKKFMLSSTEAEALKCKCSITVGIDQKSGLYKLSRNIIYPQKMVFSIYRDNVKIGTTSTSNTKLSKYGVSYSITSSGLDVCLYVSYKDAKMIVGSKKSDKLNGTLENDIFYGGKGNDTITGKNGRDVAVYDKTAWGKDTIAKTNGTMILLFKDLKSGDIVKNLSGTTMTITRKGDRNQKITVNGWNKDTHNIVFGSGMKKFTDYLKATSPTDTQRTSARNEVWQKAGLASA